MLHTNPRSFFERGLLYKLLWDNRLAVTLEVGEQDGGTVTDGLVDAADGQVDKVGGHQCIPFDQSTDGTSTGSTV